MENEVQSESDSSFQTTIAKRQLQEIEIQQIAVYRMTTLTTH